MRKIVDNLPEIFGGSGSIIGLITMNKIAEVLLFAALGAVVGLMVKEIWNFCKKKICKS